MNIEMQVDTETECVSLGGWFWRLLTVIWGS